MRFIVDDIYEADLDDLLDVNTDLGSQLLANMTRGSEIDNEVLRIACVNLKVGEEKKLGAFSKVKKISE